MANLPPVLEGGPTNSAMVQATAKDYFFGAEIVDANIKIFDIFVILDIFMTLGRAVF